MLVNVAIVKDIIAEALSKIIPITKSQYVNHVAADGKNTKASPITIVIRTDAKVPNIIIVQSKIF
jgi:hypothetical protein